MNDRLELSQTDRPAEPDPLPPTRRPALCFLAHNAYGALTGEGKRHVGGLERQLTMVARQMADRGYPVTLVSWDEGQPDGAVVDGVRVLKLCRREAGMRFVRFLHPKWTSLCRALDVANADIYYYSCGDMALGQMAMWCRGHGRKSVFAVVSEPDCDPRLPSLRPLRERVLYRHGMRLADRVIVQTVRQQTMLYEGFGKESVVVPVMCEDHSRSVLAAPPDDGTPRVFWVGRISPEKRFEWFVDLARACPHCEFHAVGDTNNPTAYAEQHLQRARATPNLVLHGRIPYDRMPEYYAQASLVCCTSAYEGFPTTFLEAWSHGVPVVTTFDPDRVVQRLNLGLVADDVPALADAVRDLLADPAMWRKCARAARAYYERNHTVEKVVRRLEAVFQELVE